jgi:hypothetical protein
VSFPTVRPDWTKIFDRQRRAKTDYAISPVHEIADDVEPDSTEEPTTLEPLVTGVTAEYPASELITDEDGDVVTAGV